MVGAKRLSCEITVKRTRLCYWIARPGKPGVQSSNISRVRFTVISHTPGRSRFYHIHIVSKRNWDGACLMNLTHQSCFFFNLLFVPLRCWILVKHVVLSDATWWRCCVRYSCYANAIVQHYDVTRFEHVMWRTTMHEWVMDIHYQTWITSKSRTPSKQ